MKLYIILLFSLLNIISGCNKTDQSKFHEASTEAEKKLDEVLRVSNKGELPSYVLKFPNRDVSNDAEYSILFTQEFLNAAAEAEKKAVESDCGGEYKKDLVCGLNFNPILCSQESSDKYSYRSLSSEANVAIIEYNWPEEDTPRAAYKLIKSNDKWLIDGVKCMSPTSDIDFNFK
jgi:hypothetical protein